MKSYSGKVFPNFKRINKWHGLIDYKSLIFVIAYVFIIWNVCIVFNIRALYSIYIIIVFTIPVLTIINAFALEDNIVDIIFVIVKYLLSRKRYMYLVKRRKYVQVVKTQNKDFVL